MIDCCSYCQREYGTVSINKQPIFKTYDHIEPRKGRYDRRRDRRGIMCRGAKSFIEIDNLISCCNECNSLKSRLTLQQFIKRVKNAFKERNKGNSYITRKIIETIEYSISILLYTNSQPLNISNIE